MKDCKITIEKTGGSGFTVTSDHFRMKCKTPMPVINGKMDGEPCFGNPVTSPAFLGGMEGEITLETARYKGVTLCRSFFISEKKNLAGIKISIENTGNEPFSLNSVFPFVCEGNDSVIVSGARMDKFRCFKLGRHKLDIPGCFRPSEIDQDYMDASLQAHKLTAGAGVQGNIEDFFTKDRISSEPLFFIKNDTENDEPGLCLSVIGQTSHLTSLTLIPDANNRQLFKYYACSEFDGIMVDPGEIKETHWIIFFEDKTEYDALLSYSEFAAEYFQVKAPGKKLTLYCSWYFYGREFYEHDLDENLDYLKRNPMPIDAFIIDNGWMDNFGDWNPNHKFPHGMERVAEKIQKAGMQPGLWSCPFIIMPKSNFYKSHPELAARTRSGSEAIFRYVEGDCFVVDPTHPACEDYFNQMFEKFKKWGFTYHKLDFMRAPTLVEDIVFYDPKMNRASAYTKGQKLLRSAMGNDCYFLSCGGIYDASNFHVVDSVRCGSDSIGSWNSPSGNRAAGTLVQIKQAAGRNYLNRFFNVDPDSVMLRRRKEYFRIHEVEKHNWLSNGLFTDAEAQSVVARQYICGGNVNFSERLAELPFDRRKLLSAIIPPIAPPARILDFEHRNCFTLALTEVTPMCDGMGKWYTLSISNWEDHSITRTINLGEIPIKCDFSEVALFEFFTQSFLGLIKKDESFTIAIPAHGTRIVRIAGWDRQKPVIIGTDCHISGGGYEIRDVVISESFIRGKTESAWEYPVTITALFPEGESFRISSTIAESNGEFLIC